MTTSDAAAASLADLVATSKAVTANAGKKKKVELIAAFLARVAPPERAIAAGYVAGEVRQKLGVGYAIVHEVLGETAPAPETSLSIGDVDRALDEIAGARGAGSAALRRRAPGGLMSRAAAHARGLSAGLLLCGLRQVALDCLV